MLHPGVPPAKLKLARVVPGHPLGPQRLQPQVEQPVGALGQLREEEDVVPLVDDERPVLLELELLDRPLAGEADVDGLGPGGAGGGGGGVGAGGAGRGAMKPLICFPVALQNL